MWQCVGVAVRRCGSASVWQCVLQLVLPAARVKFLKFLFTET